MKDLYQKKYSLDGNWGGGWIDIEEPDIIDNILNEVEDFNEQMKLADKLERGEEIEVGFFKFRRLIK